MKNIARIITTCFLTVLISACGGSTTPSVSPIQSKSKNKIVAEKQYQVQTVEHVAEIIVNGYRNDYSITKNSDGTVIVLNNSNQSSHTYSSDLQIIKFADKYVSFDGGIGLYSQSYRLYQAAFNRKPDLPGLGYWIRETKGGSSNVTVASSFIVSDEFKTLYGSVDDRQFLNLLYQNVLHRLPDAAGYDYWLKEFARGFSRPAVLASFSESAENKANVAADIFNGIEYLPYNETPPAVRTQVMHTQAVNYPLIPVFSNQDVVGNYGIKSDPTGPWANGTISAKPGSSTVLIWTNQAGFFWELNPDYAKNVLVTGVNNPYLKNANGQNFVLEYQNGKVSGFNFLNGVYSRIGVDVLTLTPYLTTYLNADIDTTKVPAGFTFGFSMYSAIWPLIDKPIRGFGAGLPGTWLQPNNDDFFQPLLPPDNFLRLGTPNSQEFYRAWFQTVEGSAAIWTATRFPSTRPKYRINGTPNGYINELSAPGWGFGEDASDSTSAKIGGLPMGSKGVAQLSNRLLMPPDGFTFKEGTAGEFFGLAWMALPLTQTKTGAHPVGNQSWTFFINSTNFKGPAAFYLPDVWEELGKIYPTVIGRGLDVRPGKVGAFVMEMGAINFYQSKDKQGVDYVRLPRISFPTDDKGMSYLVSDFTLYSDAALFTPFINWMSNGLPITGKFSAIGANSPNLNAGPIYMHSQDNKVIMTSAGGLSDLLVPSIVSTPGGGKAWAFQWKGSAIDGVYPEYFKRQGDLMKPVTPSQVPDETGLKGLVFPYFTDAEQNGLAYTSPTSWSTPSPVAGPFTVKLNDGSTVTYSWYRFVDQPSLQGFGWSTEEKNRLQTVVEKIHANWKNNTEFMAPQTLGDLATLDTALLVSPPPGMEIGFVPIVTTQSK